LYDVHAGKENSLLTCWNSKLLSFDECPWRKKCPNTTLLNLLPSIVNNYNWISLVWERRERRDTVKRVKNKWGIRIMRAKAKFEEGWIGKRDNTNADIFCWGTFQFILQIKAFYAFLTSENCHIPTNFPCIFCIKSFLCLLWNIPLPILDLEGQRTVLAK